MKRKQKKLPKHEIPRRGYFDKNNPNWVINLPDDVGENLKIKRNATLHLIDRTGYCSMRQDSYGLVEADRQQRENYDHRRTLLGCKKSN